MKVNDKQLQQGDVDLEIVDSIPVGSKVIEDKAGIILAEGEVTGHAHRVKGHAILLQAPDGSFYLKPKETTTITHEEHKHFGLKPVIYKVGKVQEWDYIEMQSRKVTD